MFVQHTVKNSCLTHVQLMSLETYVAILSVITVKYMLFGRMFVSFPNV